MTKVSNRKLLLCCNKILGVIIAILLISGGVSMPLVAAGSASETSLKVVHSNADAIDLELKVDGFHIETVEHEGQVYQRLTIPDMVQSARPGAPQIPTRGTILGIPTTEGVSVKILDAGYETLSGYRLYPAPGLKVTGDNPGGIPIEGAKETFAIEQKLYTTDAYYPGKTVEIGQTGYMRDQPVVQVQFYPVQYNPVTGEVRLYRHILARITWDSRHSVSSAKMRGESPAYENLLRNTILNYHALERSPIVREAQASGNIMVESTAASGTSTVALKIVVTENGMYKLTYNDLTGAGLSLKNVDPRTIRITNYGTETPIYVQGEDDGKFDTNDYVLFYGTAINDIYTSKNVYWLTIGEDNGQRMSTHDGTLSGSATVPTQFPVTLHAEEDDHYWQGIPNGEGQDHWFWGEMLKAPATDDHVLTLNNIATTIGTATIRVQLRGVTYDSEIESDHHTKVYLNGTGIDDQKFDGQEIYTHEVSLPHTYMNEGTNTVKVENVGDTGLSVDKIYLNWIEIDYFDTYEAENDELLFSAPETGTFQFEIDGFSSSDIEVFNVTDSANVVRITNTTVVSGGSTYKVKFGDAAQSETRYLAQTTTRRKSPGSIASDQKSSWKSTSNEADYIIITHEDFYDSALKLANYRNKSGLRVETVKIGDIYDEFNYGIFNPQAIRDFLSYAYNNWATPAPTYVLLIGDAYQDYKDNLNTGTVNYVPSQIIQTDILGDTPSDNWYVLVSGNDILPDMYIGRLSAQTKSQADDIVDKIIEYEKNSPEKSWNKNVLLVADDDDPSFEDLSEEIAGIVPDDYTVNRVYAGDLTSEGDPKKDILKYIDKGSLFVNYTGHGAVERWGLWNGDNPIFSRSDISSLNNTHKLTLVTVANCLNGFFVGRKTQISVAEEFQRIQDKGAVAVWAPTALSYTAGHRILMEKFYKAVFQDGQHGLGAATTAAKINTYSQSSYWSELVETFVLFGDPATQLGISSGSETELSVFTPNGGETITSGTTYTIQWEAPEDMVKFTLRYSVDKGRTWKKIAKKVEGSSYDWNVPAVRRNMKKCLIQVIGFDQSGKMLDKDTSASAFTIMTKSSSRNTIEVRHIPGEILADMYSGLHTHDHTRPAKLADALKALEKNMVCEALTRTKRNKTLASGELGISRASLNNKIAEFNIQPNPNPVET